MSRIFFIIGVGLILFALSCTKDKAFPIIVPPAEKPPNTISFVFVNRIGYKNDSVATGGGNYVVLSGVCLNSHYYESKKDCTFLVNTCYNRNISTAFPLKDSIIHYKAAVYNGCGSALQVEIAWKDKFLTTKKLLRYTTLNWPNTDSITSPNDTILKFVWPDDTLSGRFYKTFQFP